MLMVVDPELAEQAVFAAVRREPEWERRYHTEFARCHQASGPDARDEAFRALHARWFDELGLLERVDRLANEHPHMVAAAARLALRRAAGRSTQSVDLFGTPGRYAVGMTVAPETLLDEAVFAAFARHEFLHVDDMLDPAFGFDARRHRDTGDRAADGLVRDRYAVLWAMSCDARIEARHQLLDGTRQRRRDEFERVFRGSPSAGRFDERWSAWSAQRPTHSALLELASSPTRTAFAPNLPGAPCPVCRMRTYAWSDVSEVVPLAAIVRADFPSWTPDEGLCDRCAALFASRSSARPNRHAAISGARHDAPDAPCGVTVRTGH